VRDELPLRVERLGVRDGAGVRLSGSLMPEATFMRHEGDVHALLVADGSGLRRPAGGCYTPKRTGVRR